jgi:hypothetical protein
MWREDGGGKENVMKVCQIRLHALGIAAVAFTLLSVPAVSMAQTDQQTPQIATTHPKKHTARRWRHPYTHRNLYGWDQRYGGDQRYGQGGYNNQFPPYMSTFPEGSPSYHGPRPGVTFDDE